LLEYFEKELEIEKGRLNDKLHEKTLERIFIENRIYKRIEECNTNELVYEAIYKGFEEFKHLLRRELIDEDIQRLLAIPIRRISLFDINKNRAEIDDLLKKLEEVEYHLAHLKKYTINFLKSILKKYGEGLERRTEIETFKKIDRRSIALNNIVVGWDRKNCYIGTHVKSDEKLKCNEYDHLLLIERSGKYKVTNIPDKVFIGRIYYFGKYDKDQQYYIVYSEKKTGKFYYKQCKMGSFITDKEYSLCPKGCKIEIITTRANSVYQFNVDTRVKDKQILNVNLSEAPERSAKARGLKLSPKNITGFKFVGIQEQEVTQDSADDNFNCIQPEFEDKPEVEKNPISKENPENIQPESIDIQKNEIKSTPEISKNKSESKKSKKDKKDDDDDLDLWGVQQPEFGF
jgi:topoisomerase-4 subunit A